MKTEVLKGEYYSYLNINGYYEPDIAIHCDTNEKAEILMALYFVLGKKWGVNPIFIEKENRFVTRWKRNKTDTCYRINEEDDSCLVNGSKAYYEKKNNVVVVEFNDIFKSVINELTEKPEDYYQTDNKKKKKSLFGGKKKEPEPVKTNSSVEEKIINEVLPDNSLSVESDTSNNQIEDTIPNEEIISDVSVQQDIPEEVESNEVSRNDSDLDNNEDEPVDDVTVNTNDNAEILNENDIFASFDENTEIEDNNDDVSNNDSSENIDIGNDDKNDDFMSKFNELVEQYEKDNTEKAGSDNITSNEQNHYEQNVLNTDVSSSSHKLDCIPIMKPFIVKNDIFEGRIFRFNKNYLREEFKAKNFWVQCNSEWELSLILKCIFDNQIDFVFEGDTDD